MNEIINFGSGRTVKVITAQGEKGDAGRGIVSITKTSTLGLVDTYTILYTDGTTSTFEVTNGSGGGGGAVNSVNGQTGNVVLGASDVGALPDTTTLADLTQDSTHRTVTDAEKTSWNAKVDSVNGQTGTVVLGASDVGALPDDTTLAELPQNSAYRTVSDAEKATWNTKTTTDYTPAVTEGVKLGDISVNGTNKGVYAPRYSNPNLLDNPFFTVNQRGTTSATSTNFKIDRWKGSYGGGTDDRGVITYNSDCSITMQPNTVEGRVNRLLLSQKFTDEFYNALIGKTITFSYMLADGTIQSRTVNNVGTSSYDTNTYVVDSNTSCFLRLDMRSSEKMLEFHALTPTSSISGTPSVTLKAMKIEIGSASTLDMDIAPDYTTELLKCQRYYQKYDNIQLSGTSKGGYGEFHISYINFPPMRIPIPTISYKSGASYSYVEGLKNDNLTEINREIVDAIIQRGALMVGTPTGEPYFKAYGSVIINIADLELNAEL